MAMTVMVGQNRLGQADKPKNSEYGQNNAELFRGFLDAETVKRMQMFKEFSESSATKEAAAAHSSFEIVVRQQVFYAVFSCRVTLQNGRIYGVIRNISFCDVVQLLEAWDTKMTPNFDSLPFTKNQEPPRNGQLPDVLLWGKIAHQIGQPLGTEIAHRAQLAVFVFCHLHKTVVIVIELRFVAVG